MRVLKWTIKATGHNRPIRLVVMYEPHKNINVYVPSYYISIVILCFLTTN